jgi:hypothetical protein
VLRDALVALGLLLLVGFLVNDSGTAVPPVAALLALPLLVAVCLRALEAEDEHLAAGPGGRGGRGRTRAVRV